MRTTRSAMPPNVTSLESADRASCSGRPNAKRRPVSGPDDSALEIAIALLQGKWRVAILQQLQNGPIRLGELKRRLLPVSAKVLKQHLRQMEYDDLIVRADLSGSVPHVEYRLKKPLGIAVVKLLSVVSEWGHENFMVTAENLFASDGTDTQDR